MRGMVLQSALESGGRAVFGSVVATLGSAIDIFKNHKKIGRVQARTLVIHGTNDRCGFRLIMLDN